jgi:hypothetical protein
MSAFSGGKAETNAVSAATAPHAECGAYIERVGENVECA